MRKPPINWKERVECPNCRNTFQRANLVRHNKRGCLKWNAFSNSIQNYFTSETAEEKVEKEN